MLVRRKGYPASTKTFDTKAEASAWAALQESEMARGVWLDRSEAESTALLTLLDRYETDIVPGKRGQAQERSIIGAWRATGIAPRMVASIRGADVATQRDQWLAEGYAPASVLRRLQLLSHVFNTARREWGFESVANPIELIQKPQPNNARTRRILDPGKQTHAKARGGVNDELQRVIEATDSKLLPTLILLAVETGMRRSELVDLLWENVDFTRRTAYLPRTKNGDAREVPLSPAAMKVLQGRKPKRVTDPLNGRIFPLRADGVTQAFERAVQRARSTYVDQCKAAGETPDPRFLTDLRFHDLRHEATSRLAVVYQMHELAKITGHRDPRMLLRYYHPDAADLAKRLDPKALKSGSPGRGTGQRATKPNARATHPGN